MKIECVVDSRSELGEGAVWDARDQVLWWVDIMGEKIHRFDPASGRNDTWATGEPVGCLAPRAKGGLVIATKSGFHLFDTKTGTKTPISDPEANKPANRFNDGGTDRQGRFWAGTMQQEGVRQQVGTFYRLDPDHSVTTAMTDIWVTNGIAFSPDGKTMYASDTGAAVRAVWAFDYDTETGTPSNRRTHFDTHGMVSRPDGGTVDADGCYWFAGVGGWQVVRVTPAGTVDRIIDMPVEKPTKVMFGGTNLDTLYVTSLSQGLDPAREQPQAGSLFAITGLGVSGVPEVRFNG